MVYTILPTTNLKYEDIRDTLNSGGGSVTNDVTTAFSRSANINKWSKHKPVKLDVKFCQDHDSSAPNYDADWYKATGTTYGLKLPQLGLNSNRLGGSALNMFTGGLSNYEYLIPNGSESEPFRLGDFAGYNKNATEVFKTGVTGYPAYTYKKEGSDPIEVNMFSTQTLNFYISRTDNNEIFFYDLVGMYDDYYFVVEACEHDTSNNLPWYDPDAMIAKYRSASPINTKDPTASIQITLDSTYLNKKIMFVMGLQRYNGSEYVGGTGFYAPWKDDHSAFPSLCYLTFVNYFSRSLIGLQFSVDMINKKMYDLPNPYDNTVITPSDTLYVKFKMNRNNKRVIVVPYGSSYNPPNTSRISIKCSTIGDYSTERYGKPVNDDFQEINYIDIPEGDKKEYTEFIIKFEGLLNQSGLVNDGLVNVTIDNGSTWVGGTWLDLNIKRN